MRMYLSVQDGCHTQDQQSGSVADAVVGLSPNHSLVITPRTGLPNGPSTNQMLILWTR